MKVLDLKEINEDDFDFSREEIIEWFSVFREIKNGSKININTLEERLRKITWFFLILDRKINISLDENDFDSIVNLFYSMRKSWYLSYIWLSYILEKRLFENFWYNFNLNTVAKIIHENKKNIFDDIYDKLETICVDDKKEIIEKKEYLEKYIIYFIDKLYEWLISNDSQTWCICTEKILVYLLDNWLTEQQVIKFFTIIRNTLQNHINNIFSDIFDISSKEEFFKVIDLQNNINYFLEKKLEVVYEFFSQEREDKFDLFEKKREENENLQEQLRLRINAINNSAILQEIDKRWFVLYANNKLVDISWYTKEEINWQHTSMFSSGYHTKDFWVNMWKTIASWKVWEWKIINKNKDWSFSWLMTTITPVVNESWKVEKYIVIRFDITETEQLREEVENKNAQLETSLYFDKLTGLANYEKFQNDIFKFNSKDIVVVKINYFSKINWLYWYSIWDTIILSFCKSLQSIIDKYNYKLYRTWEMEFSIITCDNNPISRNLISELSDWQLHFDVESKEVWIKLPLRISIWHAYTDNIESLYDKWLIALYESKAQWKVIEYTDEIEDLVKKKTLENIKWVSFLKEAINEDRILPAFQWIYDNETWEINKYEALMRIKLNWDTYSPWMFLDHAINSWQIEELSSKLIFKTISKMAWNDYSFSINLRSEDIANPKTFKEIKKLLYTYDIDPSRLIIEILEEVVWTEANVVENLRNYTKLWIKIAIDDFWVGYSNISRFIQISPDYVKIDWSLINGINSDSNKQEIVDSVIAIARLRWAKLIAEFVDNKDDWEYLKSKWINYSQWFLFSKPEFEI